MLGASCHSLRYCGLRISRETTAAALAGYALGCGPCFVLISYSLDTSLQKQATAWTDGLTTCVVPRTMFPSCSPDNSLQEQVTGSIVGTVSAYIRVPRGAFVCASPRCFTSLLTIYYLIGTGSWLDERTHAARCCVLFCLPIPSICLYRKQVSGRLSSKGVDLWVFPRGTLYGRLSDSGMPVSS